MSILDRLIRSNTQKSVTNYSISAPRQSWGTRYDFYKGNTYDNAYPSIKAISNAFLDIRPYAIDANGKPLNRTRLTDVLARPNTAMSGADFREALAVSALAHRKTYILVWHAENGEAKPGGNITKDNITGFTFLENVAILPNLVNNKVVYRVDNKYTFTEDEVMVISSGVDPDDLTAGYSPSTSVKKWANVDDYIASYQAGFFENGAVPAGQFIITAGSVDQFNAIVDTMQMKHRSSGQNNNVMYVHKPVASDGTTAPAQVEWQPFSQPNNSMALGEVFKQANEKVDSAFGVPASIRGVNDNNTYASVKVDEQIFLKYTVKPFATKIWTRFVSELNRITGGLGYALTFDIELPYIADEEKVEAERKLTELNLILTAQNAGYELDSIITAFELSNGYKTLKMGENANTIIENDKPEVDEGNEAELSPNGATDVPKAKSHARHCEHECGEHSKAIDIKGKRLENRLADVLRDYMGEQIEETLRANALSSKELVPVEVGQEEFDENGDGYLDEQELANYIDSIVVVEPTNDKKAKLAEALTIIILAYMLSRGKKQYQDGLQILGNQIKSDPTLLKPETFDFAKASSYAVTVLTQTEYQTRLNNISLSFTNQISQAVKDTLKQIYDEGVRTGRGVSRNVIADKIREIVKTDEWRVQRIAVTEENHARQLAQIDAMVDLSNKVGLKVKKKWLALGGSPCEFCQAMDGTTVDVTSEFVSIGGVIQGVDGGYMQNTYDIMQSAQAHPNCQCKLDFIFEGEQR